MRSLDYERDGAAIYDASFATIRAEADLSSVPADLEPVVVRMIHACGDVDIVPLVAASPDLVTAAPARPRRRAADLLRLDDGGAAASPAARLPAGNAVRCTLHDPGIADERWRGGTTRSAAAVDRWLADLDGAVAVVGNAPTALFRLLELILAGATRPAAVLGLPVGFVGAAESKEALADRSTTASRTSPCTDGAAAARWPWPRVNALASVKEQ